MTDPGALPPRTLRARASGGTLELYFPPLRDPDVALPLALFGTIAAGLPLLIATALLPGATTDAAGLLATVFVAAFVVPFIVFGTVVAAQALYGLASALVVRVDARGIATTRYLFAAPVRRRALVRTEIAAIEPVIAARHQSFVSRRPIFDLVATDATRTRRVVVAESLRGETLMQNVRQMIERALSTPGSASEKMPP